MKNKIIICTSSNGYLGGAEKTLISFIRNTKLDKNDISIVLPKIKITDFLNELKKLEITVYIIGIDKNRNKNSNILRNFINIFINIIGKIVYSLKFTAIILKVKPKLIYLNNIYCEIDALIGKILRKKIIWHIKGLGDPNLIIKKIRYFLIKRLSDKIIFLTLSDRKKVIDLVKDKKYLNKSFIIPEGLEIDFYKKLDDKIYDIEIENIKKLKTNNKIIVGMASSISYNKGIDIFCKIAEIFYTKNKNIIFLHAGKTEYDLENSYYNNLLNQFSNILNKNLFFINYVKNIKLFLNIIDIFFFTSRSEGVPVIIIEAMFFEKPIIASNIDGNIALLENNKSGIIFNLDNFIDLENKLNALINDKSLRNSLGKNAKKRVIDDFNAINSIKKIDEIIINYLN